MRQPLAQFLSRPALRLGLPMGGVWAWVLSFPLFGPLLQHSAGADTGPTGAYYDFAMAGALALLVWLPRRPRHRYWLALLDASIAVLATLLFLIVPALVAPGVGHFLLVAILAVAQTGLYLAMIDSFVTQTDQVAPLAVAFSTAYFLQSLVAAAVELTSSLLIVALPLGLLLLLSALSIGRMPQPSETVNTPSPAGSHTIWAEVLPLAAFALAAYGVGGIWFRPVEITYLPFWPAVRSFCSALIVLTLCRYLWRRETSLLAHWALGATGVGLLLAAAPIPHPTGVVLYRLMMTLGMIAADLVYWLYLGKLAAEQRRRPIFALGLALAWGLIGIVTLISQAFPSQEQLPQSFLLTGAAIMFAVVPLLFYLPQTPPQAMASMPDPPPAPEVPEPAAAQQPLPAPPAADLRGTPIPLTAAERAVFALLITGAHDAEIAQQLSISPHTVKFHVRNILRKTGAANRTELLSQLLQYK